MALSIKTLLAPLDKTSVLKEVYTLLGLEGIAVDAFQDGEPVPAILDVVVGWIVDRLWNPVILPALQAPFLDYASGLWLSLIAALVYARPRIEALAGTASLILENRGSGFSGTVAVGQVRLKHATTGKTYTNTTSGTLLAWPGGAAAFPTVTLTFEADEVGTASNALTGSLALQPVSAPDSAIVVYDRADAVTNGPTILGSDQEDDAHLVLRIRSLVGDLSSAGPRAAYLSAALDPIGAFTRRQKVPPAAWGVAAPGITKIQITESLGFVGVYLANEDAPAAGTSSDVNSDVGKANLAIQMFIRPPGITVNVFPATQVTATLGTITLEVDAAANITAAQAIATCNDALAAFFTAIPVGGAKKVAGGSGFVFLNKVEGIITGGPGVVTALMPSFVADLALSIGDVAGYSATVQANVVDQG